MVMRIDPAQTQVDVVSFPRDLYLPLANGTTQRINAAYGEGRQVLIDTIQQNFGITINHYVEVGLHGLPVHGRGHRRRARLPRRRPTATAARASSPSGRGA